MHLFTASRSKGIRGTFALLLLIAVLIAPQLLLAEEKNSPASAITVLSAQKAFHDGDFKLARKQSQALGESEGADAYALACKSGLILGGFIDHGDNVVSSLHQALDDCRSALSIDPQHFDARFNYAVALGFEARRTRSAKHAVRSRDHLNFLLSQNLKNPLALGAIAGWHSETAKEGFLARTFLGASRKRANRYFATATMVSDDIALRYEYLRFLAGGSRKDRVSAMRTADSILKTKKKISSTNQKVGALDTLLLNRAQKILEALETKEKSKVQAALIDTAAFAEIKQLKAAAPTYAIPETFSPTRQGTGSGDE